jgi:hypothetical protein
MCFWIEIHLKQNGLAFHLMSFFCFFQFSIFDSAFGARLFQLLVAHFPEGG